MCFNELAGGVRPNPLKHGLSAPAAAPQQAGSTSTTISQQAMDMDAHMERYAHLAARQTRTGISLRRQLVRVGPPGFWDPHSWCGGGPGVQGCRGGYPCRSRHIPAPCSRPRCQSIETVTKSRETVLEGGGRKR